MGGDLNEVGTGINLFAAGEVRGVARWLNDTSDVLSIDDDDLDQTIAFVHKGGTTFLSPILPDLRGIVCAAGSRESHLAILSRESDVPCVLAADLTGEVADGDTVVLDLSGPQTAHVSVSELARRTVFESELFGMNTYILMPMMEDYLRVPDQIRTIRRHAAAADLVKKALPIGNKRSFINLAAMPLHYLTGRELFVDLGENSLSDGLEDQLEVLRFWREATIAMRTDGVLYNMDADPPDSSHVVGDELMAEILGHLAEADEATRSGIRKFGARLTAYAFLENCDARTAVCDTGPYVLSDGSFLALRETCADGDGDFPWLDGIRETLPYHHFVIAHRLPGAVKMDNNVWGTA